MRFCKKRTAATATTAITTITSKAICVEVIPVASCVQSYRIFSARESGRGCKAGVIKRVGMKTTELTKNECLYFVLPEPVQAFHVSPKATEQPGLKQDRVVAAK